MRAAVVISHYVKPPSKAALLLIAKHGAEIARKHALRELRNARRARSRIRFNFWATVIAEIDAHCRTGLSRVGPKDRYVEALRHVDPGQAANSVHRDRGAFIGLSVGVGSSSLAAHQAAPAAEAAARRGA